MPSSSNIRQLRRNEERAKSAPRPSEMPAVHTTPPRQSAQSSPRKLFGILRFFSLASLVCIAVAAVLLTTLYRQIAIRDIISFGERSNLVLAQGFLNAVRPPLVAYLSREAAHHGSMLPGELERAIAGLIENTSVVRVKIYDDEGIVTYSTRRDQIGEDGSDNAGFVSASNGAVLSRLAYRDSFNPFDKETEEDNLIQSYVPVRIHPTEPILGVFELYTDVNPMVAEIERGQLWVMAGGTAILTLLYLALLATVRHAERIIRGQQQSIRERNHALEVLSSQLLTAQEQEKKRVAHELHEGIIQTLGSIKFQVEGACTQAGAGSGAPALQGVVPLLQTTITEIRSLAMELRPSSLDDMGLVATLNWYAREFRDIYPGVTLKKSIQLKESDITAPLKVILYRLIQQTVQYFARHDGTTRIFLSLSRSPAGVHLLVGNDCSAAGSEGNDPEYWLAVQERIALSGGSSEISDNDWGGTTLNAIWRS